MCSTFTVLRYNQLCQGRCLCQSSLVVNVCVVYIPCVCVCTVQAVSSSCPVPPVCASKRLRCWSGGVVAASPLKVVVLSAALQAQRPIQRRTQPTRSPFLTPPGLFFFCFLLTYASLAFSVPSSPPAFSVPPLHPSRPFPARCRLARYTRNDGLYPLPPLPIPPIWLTETQRWVSPAHPRGCPTPPRPPPRPPPLPTL